MKQIFNIKNVSFAYSDELILNNISFVINEGDFIGLVGKNGSGKTTLLKLILGQLKAINGKIEKADNLKIGYVEQVTINSDNTFPASVMEIVLLGLYKKVGLFKFFNKSHKRIALEALKEVGLEGFSKRQISELSGGQQQKVLIAKTLVQNPDILILDEPTTGIDKESEKEFYKLLEHLNKQHQKTILIVTHSIEKVLHTNIIYEISEKQLKERTNV